MATSIPGTENEDDPLVARLTAETQAREAKLTGSLHQAIGTNPEQYAGQRRVAEQLGYPDAVVEARPDLAQQAQVQQITKTVASSPVLKQKLADDAAFAKLAHDDTGNLSKVEGAVNFLGSSLKAGTLDLMGAGAKLLDAVQPFTLSEGDAAVLYKNDPKKLQDMQMNSPSMFLSRFAKAMTEGSNQTMEDISPSAKQQYGDLQYQTLDPNKAAYLHPVKVIGDALRSLPTTAATALTIYLTRGAAAEADAQAIAAGLTTAEAKSAAIAAATKTATLVGATSEGSIGYAQQANQTAQDAAAVSDENLAQSPKYQELLANGFTHETAKAKLVADTAEQSGIIAGIVDAAVNAVGGHFLGKIIGEGGGIIKSAAKGLVNEGSTELVQSAGEQLGENASLKANVDPTQSLSKGVVESALQGLFVGGLTGGALNGIHGVANRFEEKKREAEQALQHRDALTQLDKLSSESLLRARDPATFQQFIASAAQDGPVQDVYIDANVLAQSGVADQLAQVSPSVREQFNEAISTGGSVRIPLDEYTANIAGTQLNQGIVDHIKLDPNGMTFAESEHFQQTYQEEFNKQVDQTIAAQAGDDNFKASANEVKGIVKDQLNTAGHTSPSVNDTYASMASAYYAVRAAQLGVSPKALYEQNPLTVSGARMASDSYNQDGALQTDTNTFKEWFGDSKVVDSGGKPEVVYHGTVAQPRGDAQGFDTFSTFKNELGSHFGNTAQANSFTHAPENGRVMPVYITLKNPLRMQDEGAWDIATINKQLMDKGILTEAQVESIFNLPDEAAVEVMQAAIKAKGYDGIVYLNRREGMSKATLKGLMQIPVSEQNAMSDQVFKNNARDASDSYILFDPSQIKSATGNNGDFNPNDPNILHQSKYPNVATISSAAISDFESAREYFKNNLQGNTLSREGLGDIRVTGKGWGKIKSGLKSDLIRAQLIPAIPDIIKSGEYVGRFELTKDRKDDMVAFHQFRGTVTLDGIQHDVGVTVGEDVFGKLFYNMNRDPDAHYEKAKGSNFTQELARGLEPSEADTSINLEIILNQNSKDSNRGAYSPSENTITLLKNADLSTFLHELGHAFLSMDSQLAAQVLARGATTDGEKQILADMKTLLDWFGIEGELPEQLAAWNAMSVEEQRASHEKMAEAFEAYLFEGEAPSLELQPIFQRFRAWLTNVYRNLSKYLSDAGETLTPEVRAVFDGMLATADQIKNAQQARGIAPLFQSADEAGMTPEEFAKYQQDSATSSQDAISALEARSLKDMTWTSRLKERTVSRLNKEALAIRKEVRKQVEAEIDQEPVYSAMRFLKRGETTGPNGEQIKAEAGHRLSIAGLEELYPAGELSNHPDWKRLGYGGFGMLSADGLHPDLAAQMFGFASGDDLVRSMLDAQPRNMVVDAVTDQRMLEQHGELSSPDAISKAADEVIHNDVRTRVIATELAGLQKVLGSALALSRMAKDYARQVVGKTKVKDLRPNKFAADAAKAGKLADAAMRKGNREEAVTQKRNQLVNHTTTKAAYEAAAEVKKIVAQFRKIAAAKTDTLKATHNLDLVNAARAVLAEYGVGPRAQNAREYIDLVKAYDPELYAALEPDIMMAQQNAKEIKELTIDELRALRDQVESLWYLARREQQVEINGKMMAREEVVNQLTERLDALGMPLTVPGEGKAVTEADKRKRSIQGLRASLRRVEHWVGRMDSGNYRGVFRNFIFTPISEAADRYRTDATKHIAKFRDLLKSIESSLRPGRIAAPELKYTFGHSKGDAGMAELLHAILHTGNESNKRKLLLGRGWATELEDKSLDTTKWDSFVKRMIDEGRLNKSHFDFAQGVWDLLEETKPLAQKTHREVFGRYFAEVTADSFTNQFGTYRGGYVPAITDTFEVQDAAINAAMEEANAGNAYMFPATSRGFTKSRVEYNRPLALDLRLLPAHLDKVLLFAHMERHVRDVQRVLRKMQGKLNRYDPVAYTDLLLPWLNRAAKQIVMTPSAGTAGRAMDKFLSTMRSRAGMATMFANLTNALQQITGFSITLLKVQPTHLRQAMALYIKSPGDMAKAAAALSPFMAERLDGQTFHLKGEIEDMLLNPDKYDQVKNWTQKHAYVLQSMFQNVVDTVSWTAAYNQSLANGASEEDAVRDANAAVRETQGSLQPEDISAFEAGSAWKRAFTQFASYFNMQANVMGTEFAVISQELGFRKGAGKAFYVFLFGFLVPCWVSEAIVRGMKGGGGDGDDEYLDEWLSFIFGAPLRNATAMVPIAGPIANRAAAGFTPQQYDDRMATAPAISALESAANAPASIYKAMFEDGRIKPAIKDSLTLVSMITGVPVNVLGKPLGYMADVSQGKVIPTSTADAARGLVSGVASPDSKR